MTLQDFPNTQYDHSITIELFRCVLFWKLSKNFGFHRNQCKKEVIYGFIQSFGQIGTVVSEKIQFESLYVHDLWPRSRNDLDLQYSHIFIYSIRCMLLLLTFRSLAAIVSEKSTVFTFSYRKA